MFDLQVKKRIAIGERGNGKRLELNRVSINGNREQWDLSLWRDGERLGGTPFYDDEFETLLDELLRLQKGI